MHNVKRKYVVYVMLVYIKMPQIVENAIQINYG